MLTLTLEQNRSTPVRYVRTVVYGYGKDTGELLMPFGEYAEGEQFNRKSLAWFQIRRQAPDPELEDQWLEHVDAEHAKTVAAAKCRHPGCDQRHEAPTASREDLIARGFITPHDSI